MAITAKEITGTHMWFIFMNISEVGGTKEWKRIRLSTVFDIAFNAEKETNKYIVDERPSEFIKNYKPTMAQENRTDQGDAIFDFLFPKVWGMVTGKEANVETMVIAPMKDSNGSYYAWNDMETTLEWKNITPTDNKIIYDMLFGGGMKVGTVTMTDGVPGTFKEGLGGGGSEGIGL